jgi:1,4-dihydroxy-2-naphthoate octaprenyltransferase
VAEGVACLAAYPRALISWIAEDGYPMNVDVEIEVRSAESVVRFDEPAGFHIAPGTTAAVTASHVRALPAGGFDERRHVTVWGQVSPRPRGRYAVTPNRVWAWGEDDMPLAESYGLRMAQARRYFEAVSVGRLVAIRPRMSGRLALFRASHAPFLRATVVPLLLGLAVAIRAGVVDFMTALMLLALAGAIHLGRNVAGGMFDLLHDPAAGAAPADAPADAPAGGALRGAMARLAALPPFTLGCYLAAGLLGLGILALRGSPEALAIGLVGAALLVACGTEPLKLGDRGFGEVSAAVGFGPVILLGVYAVQSRGAFSTEALVLSVPIGLLAGLAILVEEIPNRVADARAGRLKLPVRWGESTVMLSFDLAATAVFVVPVLGVATGFLPIPVLLELAAAPLALSVRSDLIRYYDSPNSLTTALVAVDRLYTNVGLLLTAGYLLTIADQIFLARAPFLR